MPAQPLNFEGKSNPMTVITPVRQRFYWRWGTWLILAYFRNFANLQVVTRLGFIHFARWISIRGDKLPHLSPDQPKEKWDFDLYLFSTNFNGPWDQYIDAFGRIKAVSTGLNLLWFTSAGFPSSWPMRLFKRYIRYFEYPIQLYYNAYPGQSVRDITMANELEPKLAAFKASLSPDMSDEEFQAAFDAFMMEAMPNLGHSGMPEEGPALEYGAHPQELSQ